MGEWGLVPPGPMFFLLEILNPADQMMEMNFTVTSKRPPRRRSLLFNISARAAITLLAGGAFFLLRPDYLDPAVLAYRHYVASPQVISGYLKRNPVRKLQIGAGPNNFPGWLNTDYKPIEGQAYLDATARFPLPDKSFDYVFSEHVIEHFNYWEGLDMLRESFRIMKPGGRIRVVTPNLNQLVRLFQREKADDQYIQQKLQAVTYWPKTPDDAGLILNLELHDWGHQFVYSPTLLRDSLSRAGFRNIRQYQVGESDDPNLVKIEGRLKTAEAMVNQFESLAMEAER
jgi:predicted SAM-dependent methyltransferase